MSAGPHRIEIETLLASLRPGEPYTEWASYLVAYEGIRLKAAA
jgi:hypothetical protein